MKGPLDEEVEFPFVGLPVVVVEPEPKRRSVTGDQMLLVEVTCHCCMDTGIVQVGNQNRRCWCSLDLHAETCYDNGTEDLCAYSVLQEL